MSDLNEYIEYLRADKATKYSDPTNVAVQTERLRIADELEQALASLPGAAGELARWLESWRRPNANMDTVMVGSPLWMCSISFARHSSCYQRPRTYRNTD